MDSVTFTLLELNLPSFNTAIHNAAVSFSKHCSVMLFHCYCYVYKLGL